MHTFIEIDALVFLKFNKKILKISVKIAKNRNRSKILVTKLTNTFIYIHKIFYKINFTYLLKILFEEITEFIKFLNFITLHLFRFTYYRCHMVIYYESNIAQIYIL